MSILDDNYNLKEYLENQIKDTLEKFKLFTTWSEKDVCEYKKLLEKLKEPSIDGETTKEKGNKLEELISFIINKSYFFEVHSNIHTGTNEIDEVIVLSKQGKQAMSSYGISRDLLEINTDVILGECKNYQSRLNVTYVGKFYSLMVASGVSFGIIFTQNGLTGVENEYRDAQGLIKVLRIIEKYKNRNDDFFILSFELEDYEKIGEGRSIFDLIKSKKLAIQCASTYDSFLTDYKHENENEIKEVIQKIN